MKLELRPLPLRDARRFVDEHHRHNDPPVGWLFGVGLFDGPTLVAVAIAGRPTGRGAQDGTTIEVTRVCTLGQRNASSRLYGALLRAAAALGYRRAYTYTLAEESGVSLRASGWTVDAELAARPTWDTPSRPREQHDLFGRDKRPAGAKIRWIRLLRP